MPQEIEIKLALEKPERLRSELERHGARCVGPRIEEDNLLLDGPAGSLKRSGSALRLRRVGQRAILTYKGPKQFAAGVGRREEHEVEVGDAEAALELLAALGLKPVWRYRKWRETWRLDDVLVLIDETRAGFFVEIEGPEQSVRSTATALGFDDSKGIERSYASLIGEPFAARL